MNRILLVCLLAAAGRTSAAELESKADEPYRLAVCLRFSDDPVFTRFFTDSVRREVRGLLAHDFGKLVELEVLAGHPLLDEVSPAGLADLALSPDDFDSRRLADKLFLATIDHDAGLYRIAWREVDGDLQRVGPLRRHDTPDRWWLSKAICLAVKDAFSPVAVVEPRGDGGRVELAFRGAQRGTRLAALLADGCVLQPYWVIRRQGGKLGRVPIPYTVLRVEPGAEIDAAATISSLPNPWRRTARVAGFQAIKLSTCSGRFRLRLLDAESGLPVQSCQVYANSAGFDAIGDQDRLPPPDRHGYVVATRPLDDLAYVRIAQPGGAISRVLVPITEPWCEQVCRLRVDEKAAEKRDFDRRVTVLVQDVQVLESMLDQHVRRVNELNGNQQYEEALKQVREAVRSVGPLVSTSRADVVELTDRAAQVARTSDRRLAWATKQVEAAAERVHDLGDVDDQLERTIEQAVALNMATTQARLAEDLIKQGDVDQAIANYREAVRISPQAGFQQRLDDLERTWQLKDHEHRMARQFVLETWPKAGITQLEGLEPEAERAFKKLVEVDDHLTARRLGKATSRHVRELADLVDMLSHRTTEADRRQCEEYLGLTERMARFQLEMGAYLENRLGGPAKPSADREEPAAAKGDDQDEKVHEGKGREIIDEEEEPPEPE